MQSCDIRQDSLNPLPHPFSTTCFTASRIFTPEECADLIGRIADPLKIDTRNTEEDGKQTTTSSSSQEGEAGGDDSFVLRIVERTSLKDADLAQWLWEHLSGLLPPVWKVDQHDEHMGPFSMGEWVLEGIDHRIQLYRYEQEGIFTQHRDGPTYHSADLRSFFTVLVYLNEGYKGGNTTLYTDDLATRYKLEGGQGSCFIMLQRTLHEGARVEEGIKYALRCDVLYRRSSSSSSAEDCVRHLSTHDQAREWFKLASSLELSGCVDASIPYYQKANKLDPSVLES